jgi:peptidoglycan/xylan/chitin deacetylase (PgdA/CDA1 family)
MIRKIYDSFYNNSPKPVQSILSKAVFELSSKPFVKLPEKPQFPGGYKGGFVVSADFELAWAWRYSKIKNPKQYGLNKARQSRQNFPLYIKYFEDYNLPITWATVGHLFLESCKEDDHNWMTKVPHFNHHWEFTHGDWYDDDPHTDFKKSPEWYAPDLIEKILNSRIKHEIGCHSFSHMHFWNDICPPEVANDEIKACVEAAKKWGIELKSMVFPGGKNGNYKALVDFGFTNYRQNAEHDLFYPEIDSNGLVRLPSSFGMINLQFNWSKEYYLYRYKKYIDKAVETGTICHAWFHPSEDPWIVKEVMPGVFKYAAELRDKGLLYIGTMNDMANLVLTKKEMLQK